MNTIIRNLAAIIAISGLLLPGCGDHDDDDVDHNADGTGAMHGDHATTDNSAMVDGQGTTNTGTDHDHANGVADHEHGVATHEHTNGMDNGGVNTTPRTFLVMTYKTPAEERTGTKTALNGLRSTLMAELEAVRERLGKASGETPAKAADQKRAAELAQGLERMDRLIEKIGGADDVSWSKVRESSLKEAEEVRVWMQQYQMPNSI